jgi:hypothetical protein
VQHSGIKLVALVVMAFSPFVVLLKSDLSSTTKCDKTRSIVCYDFGHTVLFK